MIERIASVVGLLFLAGCGGSSSKENAADSSSNRNMTEATPAPSAAPVRSRDPIAYTSLNPVNCRLLEQNVNEAGYARHLCNGLAGYKLETTESDLRQDISVIAPDGKRSALGLSTKVAKGAFNSLGLIAEWRGSDGKNPTALIVRLGVADGAAPNRPDISNLVVVKLATPACVLAVVPPSPRQNELARDAADQLKGACI